VRHADRSWNGNTAFAGSHEEQWRVSSVSERHSQVAAAVEIVEHPDVVFRQAVLSARLERVEWQAPLESRQQARVDVAGPARGPLDAISLDPHARCRGEGESDRSTPTERLGAAFGRCARAAR
jgi:hypothetical protein